MYLPVGIILTLVYVKSGKNIAYSWMYHALNNSIMVLSYSLRQHCTECLIVVCGSARPGSGGALLYSHTRQVMRCGQPTRANATGYISADR